MNTPRLVAALLIVCGLLILTLQNSAQSLPLVFLGMQSVSLPIGAWLSGAIALGALTTLLLTGGTSFSPRGPQTERANRRRWQVRDPGTTSPEASTSGNRPSSSGRSQSAAPRSTPKPDIPPPPAAPKRPRPPRNPVAAEDWQTWGERQPASQWESWSQAETASGSASSGRRPSKRQQADQQKARENVQKLEEGWDSTAYDTVYVPPGGSTVEDALDDIATGWDEEDVPAATAYSYNPSTTATGRVDAVYAPPDDAGSPPPADGSRNEDWRLDPEDAPADEAENSGIYDADYRVIVPPHRPLDESADNRDRAS